MAYFPADVHEFDITQFQGSAQAVDPYVLDSAHGLYAQNIDYVIGTGATPMIQAATRRGSSQVAQFPNDGPIVSMFQWYVNNAGTQDCLVVYYAPTTGIKYYSQRGNSFNLIKNVTSAKYLSFATDGIRGYFATGDVTGRFSNNPGYIYNAATGNLDALFAPPFLTSSVSQSSAFSGGGVITAGTHRIYFLYTTRNGYSGPVSPVSTTGMLVPLTQFTAGSGTIQLALTINFSTSPTFMNGGTVQVVMTTAANQSRLYAVPGTITTFASSVTITVNIDDGDLVATGTDVTQQQNLLASNPNTGAAPFDPSALFAYSSRMGYVTLDQSGFPVVYFSDPSNYQSLTAAYHGIYLEGKEIPVHGCSIGQTCYIASLSALFGTSDNGGYPATWTPPQRIDGSVGILAPSNMLCAGGRILLASEKGLFSYHGSSFPQIPLSYWQAPDWNRINWAAPTQVSIVDDSFDRVIRVTAPLKVLVTNATNASPIVVTTGVQIGAAVQPYPHLIQSGLNVTISGVGGNTNANTTCYAQYIGPTQIALYSDQGLTTPIAGNGAYTSGGVVTPNSPNAEMTWNYSQGETPGSLLYALNGFAAYRQGASATVKHLATNTDEVWYAPSQTNPGGLVRRVLPSDTTLYQDVDLTGSAAAIADYYETGIVPATADQTATVHDFDGAHLRVSGNGGLALIAYGLDHVISKVPAASPLTLANKPGQEVLVKWWLRSEQQTLMLSTNAIGAYMILAWLRIYWRPSLVIR